MFFHLFLHCAVNCYFYYLWIGIIITFLCRRLEARVSASRTPIRLRIEKDCL